LGAGGGKPGICLPGFKKKLKLKKEGNMPNINIKN
jgi:hypothetical protein